MRRRGATGLRAIHVAELRRLDRAFPGVAKNAAAIEAGDPFILTPAIGDPYGLWPDVPCGTYWLVDEQDNLTQVVPLYDDPSLPHHDRTLMGWVPA